MKEQVPFSSETTSTEPNDACVANTIVSICSSLSGLDLKVPEIYYQWRSMMNQDMARMYANHQRRIHSKQLPKKDRSHYDAALHRLDQQSVVKFINTAREGRGIPLEAAIIQTILLDTEIEFKKGGLSSINQEINLGRELAVCYQIEGNHPDQKDWHIAHIRKDQNDRLISLSDGNILLTSTDMASIDSSAEYLTNNAHTWNFVSVRKFGD